MCNSTCMYLDTGRVGALRVLCTETNAMGDLIRQATGIIQECLDHKKGTLTFKVGCLPKTIPSGKTPNGSITYPYSFCVWMLLTARTTSKRRPSTPQRNDTSVLGAYARMTSR